MKEVRGEAHEIKMCIRDRMKAGQDVTLVDGTDVLQAADVYKRQSKR